MDKSFLSASEEIGRNFNLIQGAGGNTSYKDGDNLFVKASGHKLKDSLTGDIFIKVNLKKLRKRLIDNIIDPLDGTWDQSKGKKPSMETNMHAILPQKYIFHTHCLNTISFTVQKDFEKRASKIFSKFKYAIIKYKMPGLPLAREIQKIIKSSKPEIIFLSNHGLVICSDELDKVLELTYLVSKSLDQGLFNCKKEDIKKLNLICKDSFFRPTVYREANNIAFSDYKIKIASSGSLYPDHVVFLGSSVLIVEKKDDLKIFMKDTKFQKQLPIVIVPKGGILVPKNISSEAEELVLALSKIISNIPENRKINYLNLIQENALQSSDEEKHRLKQTLKK